MAVKFGVHCYVLVDRWCDAQLHVLETARELGLEAFEIAVGDDVRFTASATRELAQSLGLVLTISPGGQWPLDCDLSSDDPAERARGLAWHRQQVDVAAELGAIAYTGALYGHPGTVKRRMPPSAELGWTAEGLHELAAYGASRGVKIVLEPMSRFRTHLVNTPGQLVRLLDLADHENLSGLLDTYHLITEVRDYGAGIRAVGARLWGLHACENDRGVPGGGLVPWAEIFAALEDIHFDGYVYLETYNSSVGDPPGSFARSRGIFQDLCPDGAAFVRQGLAFLRTGLAGGKG